MVVKLKKPAAHKHKGRRKRKLERPEEIHEMEPTLQQRCRQLGLWPTEANLRFARREDFEAVYAVIIYNHTQEIGDEYQELFTACKEIDRAYNRNWRRLGKRVYAKTAAFDILHEEKWADPEAKPKEQLTENQIANIEAAIKDRHKLIDDLVRRKLGPHAIDFLKIITLQPDNWGEWADTGLFIKNLKKITKSLQDVLD